MLPQGSDNLSTYAHLLWKIWCQSPAAAGNGIQKWHKTGNVTLSQEIIPHMRDCAGIRKCVHPWGKTLSGSKLAGETLEWAYTHLPQQDINRKSLHGDNYLIPKEIIHRKKLYIDHEKDPHLTGTISTADRKTLHDSACNLLIYLVKNMS